MRGADQLRWVVPRMTSSEPPPRAYRRICEGTTGLHSREYGAPCMRRSTKSRASPKETDAMLGVSPSVVTSAGSRAR